MLRNWLRRRSQTRRRAVFRYWDGRRYSCADPLQVYRALSTHAEFDWSTHPKLVDEEDHDATVLTVSTMREVFKVPAFEDGGLTEAECIALLVDYVAYLTRLKKKVSRLRTSPVPMVPPSSPIQNDTTPKQDSDSGSTSAEPKPDEPEEP